MINKNEIPKSWEVKKLNEVCESILGGGTPSTSNEKFWDGEIPWISSADIYGLRDIQPRRSITKKAIEKSTTNLLPKGGIIVVTRVGLGKIAIAPFDLCFSQDSQGLILNEKIISKSYALLCLSKAVQMFKYKSRGTTISGVTKKQLVELEIPLPPLAEQERIVAKIEELFSELDTGTESLKRAHRQLKIYRQAVLKYAFEGRLTNEKLNDGELPKSWKLVEMGEVIEQLKYGTSKKCDYKFEGKAVLRIPNIGNNSVDNSDLKFASFDEKEIETYRLKEGDLLTIRSNGSVDLVGKCALITKKDEEYLYAGYLIRLRPLKEIINPKFLINVLSSSSLRIQIESKAKSTSGVNNINSDEFKSLVIPLCSLAEQQRVVEEIESRLSVCDKLEETINASLQQAESLRQSILKKAFEGRLVAAEEKPVYQPNNIKFYQIQVLAFMLIYFRHKGFRFAEMTSAKNTYLLNKIYGIPIYDNYKRWHLGPYSAEIKQTINNKTYFRKNGYNGIEVLNEEKLFKYSNPYQQKIEDAVNELAEIYSSFTDPKTRAHKIELLATVCKVIEDIQTTELEAVRQSMAEWKISLKDKKFNDKAQKFGEVETAKCIEFIKGKGWDKKLII